MASMAAPSGSSPACGAGATRIASTRSGQPATACSAVRKGAEPEAASPKALASNWPSGPRIAKRMPPCGSAPDKAAARRAGSVEAPGEGSASLARLAAICVAAAAACRESSRPPSPGSAPGGRAAAAPGQQDGRQDEEGGATEGAVAHKSGRRRSDPRRDW